MGPGRVYETQGHIAWSPDGRTIHYNWVPEGAVRAVWSATMTDPDGPTFDVQPTGVGGAGILWGTTPDGRLLLEQLGVSDSDDGDDGVLRLVIVANWLDALEERLGTGN